MATRSRRARGTQGTAAQSPQPRPIVTSRHPQPPTRLPNHRCLDARPRLPAQLAVNKSQRWAPPYGNPAPLGESPLVDGGAWMRLVTRKTNKQIDTIREGYVMVPVRKNIVSSSCRPSLEVD